MASERIDPELLAAFLDGGLDGDEAERVREQLSRSGESYQLLLESSAVLRELEAGAVTHSGQESPSAAPVKATQSRPRRSFRPVWTIGSVLLAAGIGAILITRRASESTSPLPHDAATASSIGDLAVTRLAAGWNEPGWSTVRGAGSLPSGEAAAFRVGARFVELEVALNARDTTAAAAARATLVALLNGIDGGALAAPSIAGFTMASLTTEGTRRQTVDQLRSLAPDPVWFDLGAWCESTRLAVAASTDPVFVQPASSRQTLGAILQTTQRLPTPSRRAADEVLGPLRAFVKADSFDRATAARLVDSAVATGGSIIPR